MQCIANFTTNLACCETGAQQHAKINVWEITGSLSKCWNKNLMEKLYIWNTNKTLMIETNCPQIRSVWRKILAFIHISLLSLFLTSTRSFIHRNSSCIYFSFLYFSKQAATCLNLSPPAHCSHYRSQCYLKTSLSTEITV